ncbi:MAG TPA: zinc-binding dehydrogenase [Candidatus Cybelea sp.]|jgi:NADPH:quinone reductase-like Zn-dependent oxidoreductase|nr:zinc-binding dehydrogenase [Candidatus Cybelea sp.]
MRAVRLHEVSGPQGLRIDDVTLPAPAEGEVLVRIRAAALNRRDVFITQGLYPKIALPVTLGSDGAGELTDTGEEVVIDPMLSWGDDPHVWDASKASILGMPHDGTFAQYVAVPKVNVYPKPAHLSMQEAAAIPLAGLTAYRALFTRGSLARGETILIPGVGGGVQTFALLFAKQAGARAIVTSSSDEKLERAKSLGADLCVNYRTNPDWAKSLREAGPIDIAVDSTGGETLRKALDIVRPGGRVVVYGGTTGEASIKLFPLFWKHLTILGTSMGSPGDFTAMLDLFGKGIRPVVDRVFSLGETSAAAQHLLDANQFGKVVLNVDG